MGELSWQWLSWGYEMKGLLRYLLPRSPHLPFWFPFSVCLLSVLRLHSMVGLTSFPESRGSRSTCLHDLLISLLSHPLVTVITKFPPRGQVRHKEAGVCMWKLPTLKSKQSPQYQVSLSPASCGWSSMCQLLIRMSANAADFNQGSLH